MTNKLFRPPGPIARRIEGAMTCLFGLCCFLAYGLIKFDLCANNDCSGLKATKFHASNPELYLLYGAVVILTGVCLYTDKDLPFIFRFGIELTALIGVFLSCIVVFGVSIELNNS